MNAVCYVALALTAFPLLACSDREAAATGGAQAATVAVTDADREAPVVLDTAAAATITPDDVSRRIGVIAHDSMQGRRTPSPELDATAAWLAGELEAMGITPGGDEGYQQRYEVELTGGTSPGNVIRAPNVVGILEGSDPVLRDEYVVLSAHMDHVGVGKPDASGDSIYNGADDDASGTVAVLEIAEAFAALEPAPRRSIIFLWVSGEERGLWGSRYFADNPPVPTGQMVANLNLDMVGRNWPDTIVAIGKEHSDLGATLHAVADRHPELGMDPIDDLWPEESFYTRSDHYNFARKGVPVLFFFNGTHEDYHRPSDEPELIDAEKTSRIARLVFYLGLEVANAPDRPRWEAESYRRIVGQGR
jgi:hypothetical protein